MTSAAELLALADRIECLEGSRELDRKISRFFAKHFYEFWRERIGGDDFTIGAPYDLTAPMSLVPPGWDHSIIKRAKRPYQGKFPFEVVLYRRVESNTSYDACGGFGRSQKSALCAAALRARAAESASVSEVMDQALTESMTVIHDGEFERPSR